MLIEEFISVTNTSEQNKKRRNDNSNEAVTMCHNDAKATC